MLTERRSTTDLKLVVDAGLMNTYALSAAHRASLGGVNPAHEDVP
jgi:hypothetical protein